MKTKNVLEFVVAAMLAVVLLSLVLGHVLGYPVLLAYVESGSMEPTLNTGDGFIAVPTTLTGAVEPGDVVVFQAEALHGGEITTHRIVEERPNGYVTQGDANPFPDQSLGEPLVTDGQIKATALTVDGTVVRIPHLGTVTGAVGSTIDRLERAVAQLLGVPRLGQQQLAYILFGSGLVAFAVTVFGSETVGRERSRDRARSRSDILNTRYILVGSILVLCTGATLGMVAPAGTETFGIVSSEGNSSNPTIIPVGGTDSYESQLYNGGFVPTVSYFEPRSDGIEIEPERIGLGARESANATVTLHAPDETGYYLRSMTEYRYFAILPPSMLDSLYRIHPWTPYLLINGLFATALLVVWVGFQGPDKVRIRRRKRNRRTARHKNT